MPSMDHWLLRQERCWNRKCPRRRLGQCRIWSHLLFDAIHFRLPRSASTSHATYGLACHLRGTFHSNRSDCNSAHYHVPRCSNWTLVLTCVPYAAPNRAPGCVREHFRYPERHHRTTEAGTQKLQRTFVRWKCRTRLDKQPRSASRDGNRRARFFERRQLGARRKAHLPRLHQGTGLFSYPDSHRSLLLHFWHRAIHQFIPRSVLSQELPVHGPDRLGSLGRNVRSAQRRLQTDGRDHERSLVSINELLVGQKDPNASPRNINGRHDDSDRPHRPS